MFAFVCDLADNILIVLRIGSRGRSTAFTSVRNGYFRYTERYFSPRLSLIIIARNSATTVVTKKISESVSFSNTKLITPRMI